MDDITSHVIDNNLDIVVLTETWLRASDTITPREITPSGFSLVQICRHGRRGGGVAVLYRSHLSFKKSSLPAFNTFECLEVSFSECGSTTTCTFLVIYRPPSTSECQFLQEFSNLLNTYVRQPGWLVILGDFNIHWDCKEKRNVTQFSMFSQQPGWSSILTCQRTHMDT